MNKLNKPYPLDIDFEKNVRLSLIIGVFIFLFLYLFQPVSVIYGEDKMNLITAMSYGLVTIFTMIMFIFFVPKVFPEIYDEEKWTVKKEIINYTITILLIALFNYLLTLIFFDTTIQSSDTTRSFDLVFPLLGSTFLIAIFPIVGLIFYKQNILLKKYLEDTKSINQTLNKKAEVSTISLKGEGKNEVF